MGKICRSRAPLRLGLAGGGTDVSPYCDMYGGQVLNATISLFAYVDIEKTNDGNLTFESKDFETIEVYRIGDQIVAEGELGLLKGVYLRILRDYPFDTKGLKITSYVQAPPGSGLGSSSTLVVALISAFVETLQLPLGEYDIASYAFDIVRKDLNLAGGRQDQYAATFGGFNFMEFYSDNKTIVNPLIIKADYSFELEKNMVLFYTSRSRESSRIIDEQVSNVRTGNRKSIVAMHQIREQSVMMKEGFLRGELHRIGEIFVYGHLHKKTWPPKSAMITWKKSRQLRKRPVPQEQKSAAQEEMGI